MATFGHILAGSCLGIVLFMEVLVVVLSNEIDEILIKPKNQGNILFHILVWVLNEQVCSANLTHRSPGLTPKYAVKPPGPGTLLLPA